MNFVILVQISWYFQVIDSAVLSQEQESESVEVPDPPHHPQFSDESERLETFRTWEVQSPKTLSRAGFFYTGDTFIYSKVYNCF